MFPSTLHIRPQLPGKDARHADGRPGEKAEVTQPGAQPPNVRRPRRQTPREKERGKNVTQTEKTHCHLTDEENFPDNLDWSIDVEIREKERDQGSQLSIKKLEWEYALDQSLRFIGDTFPEFDTFYDNLDGRLTVGYTFDFRLGPSDEIAIMSKMHPAVINKYVTSLIDEEIIAEACLVIKFKNQRTEETVREYLREEIGQSPEELPLWGKAQPEGTDATHALYIKLQAGLVHERVKLSENAALDVDPYGILLGISLQQVSALQPEHNATGGPAVFIRRNLTQEI